MTKYRSLRQTALRLAAAACLALPAASVCLAAPPPTTEESTTTLQSNADRMISYRFEEHSWQTSDGAYHVLVNTGSNSGTPTGAGLILYSSFDSGNTWTRKLTLASTANVYSTDDGVLVGDTLHLVYASGAGSQPQGTIQYSTLLYNESTKQWSLTGTETVFSSTDHTLINPALAIDASGAVWCAFVYSQLDFTPPANPYSEIKLATRAVSGGWQDTGLVFGPNDNSSASVERSGRPVATANGVGMIYAAHQSFFWAYRLNNWAATHKWSAPQTIFTSTPPYDDNPYESHFAVVADKNQNLHMAEVDHGRLLYFSFVNSQQAWNPPRVLTGNIQATYPQISYAPSTGTLAIVVNNQDSPRVFQSTDNGSTFIYSDLISHDLIQIVTPGNTLDFDNPRIETPGIVNTATLPVLQQYTESSSSGTILTDKAAYAQITLCVAGQSDICSTAAPIH